jgi:hypothetical protein
MSTTHTLSANAAIGVAPKPNRANKMAPKPGNRKKIFELGLLAGAIGATIVLTLKAATILNAVLASMDAVYKSLST